MLRKDKEINDIIEIENIIQHASVCRLALSQDDQPYIVPLCFGYMDNALYFHSAGHGKKLEILKDNPNVCFEIDTDHSIVEADQPCDWGMKYKSVLGFGEAVLIEDIEAKRKALNIIMHNYSNQLFEYPEESINNTVIIKVKVKKMTGKKSGY